MPIRFQMPPQGAKRWQGVGKRCGSYVGRLDGTSWGRLPENCRSMLRRNSSLCFARQAEASTSASSMGFDMMMVPTGTSAITESASFATTTVTEGQLIEAICARSGPSKIPASHSGPNRRASSAPYGISPLDPYNYNAMIGIGYAHSHAERFEQALVWITKGIAERPSATWAWRGATWPYVELGRMD